MVREAEAVSEEEAALEAVVSDQAVSEKILDLEKCTKQFALSAERNAKFLSNLQKANLFFARIALEKGKDSDSLSIGKHRIFYLIF